MTHFTHSQIAAAKNGDAAAVASLVAETEGLVLSRAQHFAGSPDVYGNALADDLAQAGRVAVWTCAARFTGTAPAAFMAYLDRCVDAAMLDALRAETRPGVTPQAAKDFETALALADGDPHQAERVAASAAMGARRMSPGHARAARLSWLGPDRLDRTVAADDGEPLTPAHAWEHDAAGGSADGGDDGDDGDTAGDPGGAPDASADPRRAAVHDRVHRALAALSERQRHVVMAATGIAPVPEYRPGVDDDELAADLGATRYQVQQARTKGFKRFAERYALLSAEDGGAGAADPAGAAGREDPVNAASSAGAVGADGGRA